MGLLKMFGVGGGKLDVVLDQTQVAAGDSLTGVAKFIGGKRDQTIDALTLSVSCTTYRMEQTPEGPQRRSDTNMLVPKTVLASDIHSEAKGELALPFSFPIPPNAWSSQPGAVEYRLHGAADIDGEVDPGDSEVFVVVGGLDYVAPQETVAGVLAEFYIGARVVAMSDDGSWQPGRVTNVTEELIGVDWDEVRLGASSWVRPQDAVLETEWERQQGAAEGGWAQGGAVGFADVKSAAGGDAKAKALADAKARAAADAKAKALAEAKAKAMLDEKAKAAVAGKAAGMHSASGAQQMAAKGAAPGKTAPAPAAAPVKVGMQVYAQFTDGSWHPGKVVQLQDAWIGVDWDDPKLGQSSWVQAHQIKPR